MTPLILGVAGPELTADERALFRDADPAGFILFGRNIETPPQLRALTASLRDLTGRDHVPILIDQEGGRVARLGPPHWHAHPPAARFGDLFAKAPMTALEAARLHGMAMGRELRYAGIDVTCTPVLDLRHDATHVAIGDRAFARDPRAAAGLGRAVLRGLASAGVHGVLKHMPGQGRATADSHHVLPVVDADHVQLAEDFAAFAAVSDAGIGMMAHVRYMALDERHCASQSEKVIREIVRGEIGFGGLLLSDDIAMDALAGDMPRRMAGVLSAGCDLALYGGSNSDIAAALCEMAPAMTDAATSHLRRIADLPATDMHIEPDAAARRDDLLAFLEA
ncbi:MAG: beta-N-acetylhexosaminidase [Pseudomonadota bacterium]